MSRNRPALADATITRLIDSIFFNANLLLTGERMSQTAGAGAAPATVRLLTHLVQNILSRHTHPAEDGLHVAGDDEAG